MINEKFIEGINILSNYVETDEYDLAIGYGQLWFGPESPDLTPEEEESLKDGGWFFDDEYNRWSCST